MCRRAKFAGLATIDGGLLLQSIHSAADGTRKMVFKVAHGPAAGGQVRWFREQVPHSHVVVLRGGGIAQRRAVPLSVGASSLLLLPLCDRAHSVPAPVLCPACSSSQVRRLRLLSLLRRWRRC